jgi:hypothetical protein
MKLSKDSLREIIWAENKLDCYQGDKCNEKEPYWSVYVDGDHDSDQLNFKESLEFNPEAFPAGTRVVLSIPLCPNCDMDSQLCECDFDWNAWGENKYS